MFAVELITPEAVAFKGDAQSVTLPSGDGELTVLTGHVPIVTTLAPGTMIVRNAEGEQMFAVARGVIEITQSSLRVLSDIADRVETLEEAAIEAATKRAEALVAEKRMDAEGFAEATAVLDREMARLKSVRRRRSHRPPTA
jgi:F-type H+-transporting ATPase subunit epsilon